MFSSNTCTTLTSSPSQFSLPQCRLNVVVSASFRRRSRSRSRRRHDKLTTTTSSKTTTTTSSSEPKLETIIDLNHLTFQASSTFRTLFPNFHSDIREFLYSGKEAYRDLQNLVTLDDSRSRLVVSCRPSTLRFVGTSAVLSFVAFLVLRVLVKLVSGVWFWSRKNASGYSPMVRRDRSLGGREVVVGWGHKERVAPKLLANPLSASMVQVNLKRGGAVKNNKVRIEKKLPKWWPTNVVNGDVSILENDEQEEYRREAYRVVRAIKDSRLGGKDIMENDIIQLRQLCRASGVQVSIEPTNIRDSLYRASVNFVLNVCSSYSTLIDINGEDARQFLAGFAENIGLENVRAATIVTAAVAARTRSCLLQAWALEMQGKHVDAKVELSKICLLLRIFPPEESSPEMEMVSRGLQRHLKPEQRKHLMFLFGEVCGEDSHGIAREALGLVHSQTFSSDQLEDNIL